MGTPPGSQEPDTANPRPETLSTTPLHQALHAAVKNQGHIDVVKHLLNAGAKVLSSKSKAPNPNISGFSTSHTPTANLATVYKASGSAGSQAADPESSTWHQVDAKTHNGNTALHLACAAGHLDVCKVLIRSKVRFLSSGISTIVVCAQTVEECNRNAPQTAGP